MASISLLLVDGLVGARCGLLLQGLGIEAGKELGRYAQLHGQGLAVGGHESQAVEDGPVVVALDAVLLEVEQGWQCEVGVVLECLVEPLAGGHRGVAAHYLVDVV